MRERKFAGKLATTVSMGILLVGGPEVLTWAETALIEGETVLESGVCGDSMTWEVTELDGVLTLTISGSGAMYDYAADSAPWSAYKAAENLVYEGDITHIGNNAYWSFSSFTGDLVIPSSVTSIGEWAYGGTGFNGNLILPDSVTTIGMGAFTMCGNLTGALDIPDNLTTISSYTFDRCSGLTGDLLIPDGVMSIQIAAFSGCSGFTGILDIPESVTDIQSEAFRGCSGLTGTLDLPDGITSLQDHVFFGCSGFTGTVEIPAGVNYIASDAMSSCEGIDQAIFYGNAPTIGANCFPADLVITYHSSKSGWSTPTWNGYTTTVIEETVVLAEGTCGDNLTWKVEDNTGIQTLTISGSGAMYDYSPDSSAPWSSYNCVQEIIYDGGITHIGDYAFWSFKSVDGDLVIPSGVTSIGNYAYVQPVITELWFCRTAWQKSVKVHLP